MLGHLTFMLVASHAVQKRMREDKGGGGLEEGVHLAELGGCDGGGSFDWHSSSSRQISKDVV